MLPGAASATESKEFKRVKQKIEVSLAVFRHFNAVNWAVIQSLRASTVHTREVMAVLFNRGIQCLSSRYMAAAHETLLL